jgi:3-deoxy-D-manno-octulosonic-acid transferase
VLRFLERTGPAKVWVAASTTAPDGQGDVDEDDAVLAAFREASAQCPGLLLILAPRKPERFEAAARKLDAAGIPWTRRSSMKPEAAAKTPHVLLLDTIGELSGLFAAADLVFMGGTLARRGGHNVLEPALFGKAVIAGPHMENFQAIADDLTSAGGCVRVSGAAELSTAVARLLEQSGTAEEIGRRALACAEAQRGAGARAIAEIRELYARQVPRYRPAMPWYGVARLLSQIWIAGARRRQARDFAGRRTLDVPVISVGNLTMGGTGKTPCVLRIAELLRNAASNPAS